MFSERKKRISFVLRIQLFLFSEEKQKKKGNLFLRFWLIMFSKREKKDFFCFKNPVVFVF